MKKVKWLPCLLLSIFLGGFGVDRFYMGHIILGIFKLITCGGGLIWIAVDIILISQKHKFKDIEWIE
jgi:TM2 domain-containing membrane protein YozV